MDFRPTVIYHDLALTNDICKDPISKRGHVVRFRVDVNFEWTLVGPAQGELKKGSKSVSVAGPEHGRSSSHPPPQTCIYR